MLPRYPEPIVIPYFQDSLGIISLRDMIKNKIKLLQQEVQDPWHSFFRIPGTASIKEKKEKIKALQNLQIRIYWGAQDDIRAYSEDVLDGDTLALYKLASEVFTSKFTNEEVKYLHDRDPCYRLLRGGCIF
jgi:hypothetical protein